MKKIILFFFLFLFFFHSNTLVLAQDYHLAKPDHPIELSFQDLPDAPFSGKAQELDTGLADTRSEHRSMIVIAIIAGVLSVGGVVGAVVALK